MSSTLVNLTRSSKTVQGFQILDPTDMVTALTYLATVPIPYSGSICYQLNGSAYVWTLTLSNNRAATNLGSAYINDWIILDNNAVASICPAAAFASFYAAG